MTVPSGEVTVLMSWPRFVEAGRVNLMTAGTATTHRSRTVAIHRSGDAVPRAQAHHRSSPAVTPMLPGRATVVRTGDEPGPAGQRHRCGGSRRCGSDELWPYRRS